MEILVKNKKVKIPEDTIRQNMEILGISENDAIQMYLEDEGYIINETVEELTKKAKANKTDKIVVTDKTKKREYKRKPTENPLKSAIIQDIYQFLTKNPTIYNVNVENPTKIITFMAENKQFKLDLVEKRQKKE